MKKEVILKIQIPDDFYQSDLEGLLIDRGYFFEEVEKWGV